MAYAIDFRKVYDNIELFQGGIELPEPTFRRCCCLWEVEKKQYPEDMILDETVHNHFVQIMFFLNEYYYEVNEWKSFSRQQLTEIVDDEVELLKVDGIFSSEFNERFSEKIDEFLLLFCKKV